jgi:hypothetical protein
MRKEVDVVGNYIEYGYDRAARSWCILVLDKEGNQISSSYVGDREGLKAEIEFLAAEYKVEKIIKVKAY